MAGAYTFYPRASYGLQTMGPSIAQDFYLAGRPQQVVNSKDARPITKPVTNNFEFNANTLKDAVGYKTPQPERVIHPNLRPTVNLSLQTTKRSLDPILLREDIYQDTKKFKGVVLLSKLRDYVKDMYKADSSPFELSARPFQSLVKACQRLKFNPDPVAAGGPPSIDENADDDVFTTATIWLLGAPQDFDVNLKPGYIYVGQTMVPVSTLRKEVQFILDLKTRRASIGKSNANLAEVGQRPTLPDVGDVSAGGPSVGVGRDGDQSQANQDPLRPEIKDEVKALENAKEAIGNAENLKGEAELMDRVFTEIQGTPRKFEMINEAFTAGQSIELATQVNSLKTMVFNRNRRNERLMFPNAAELTRLRMDREGMSLVDYAMQLLLLGTAGPGGVYDVKELIEKVNEDLGKYPDLMEELHLGDADEKANVINTLTERSMPINIYCARKYDAPTEELADRLVKIWSDPSQVGDGRRRRKRKRRRTMRGGWGFGRGLC